MYPVPPGTIDPGSPYICCLTHLDSLCPASLAADPGFSVKLLHSLPAPRGLLLALLLVYKRDYWGYLRHAECICLLISTNGGPSFRFWLNERGGSITNPLAALPQV